MKKFNLLVYSFLIAIGASAQAEVFTNSSQFAIGSTQIDVGHSGIYDYKLNGSFIIPASVVDGDSVRMRVGTGYRSQPMTDPCFQIEHAEWEDYTLKIKNSNRDALVKHLGEQGIPCGVYYPIPLHLQKAYKDERYKEENFVVTNELVTQVISLPMHTELDDEQIEYITKTVIEFLDN